MKKLDKIILKEEKVTYTIKDEQIDVNEKYYINLETNERIYDREFPRRGQSSAGRGVW